MLCSLLFLYVQHEATYVQNEAIILYTYNMRLHNNYIMYVQNEAIYNMYNVRLQCKITYVQHMAQEVMLHTFSCCLHGVCLCTVDAINQCVRQAQTSQATSTCKRELQSSTCSFIL